VHSRLSTSTTKRKAGSLSSADKDQLLRIGKRPRKGPLNAYVDETELGKGSALFEPSAAAKQVGYNVWNADEDQTDVPETVRKVDPKVIFLYLII
jgi:nucleolar protein 53